MDLRDISKVANIRDKDQGQMGRQKRLRLAGEGVGKVEGRQASTWSGVQCLLRHFTESHNDRDCGAGWDSGSNRVRSPGERRGRASSGVEEAG